MPDTTALTFSLTAPSFSLAQTQAERDSLAPSERETIDAQVWGTAALPKRETWIEESVAQLKALLLHDTCSFPYYHQAQQLDEIDYVAFLRCEQWNVTAAAQRVEAYWKYRVQVFGEERAFLPMAVVSGEGALTSDEVEALLCGGIQWLPDDAVGRTLIYTHRQDFYVYPNPSQLVVRRCCLVV